MRSITVLRRAALVGAALVSGFVFAGPARASNIVFVKNNDIWASSPDGAIQRQLTSDGTPDTAYRSPTETDAGVVVIAASDRSFYRRSLDGSAAGGPWTSADMNSCSSGPLTAQVAPDDTLITYFFAYSDICLGGGTFGAQLATASANSPTSAGAFPTFDGLENPRWIPGLAGPGAVRSDGSEIDVATSGGYETWLSAAATGGYIAAFDASRVGNMVLIAFTTSPSATAGTAGLVLWANGGPPPDASGGHVVCTLSNWADYNSMPRWSPDGTQFTWSSSGGVYTSPAPITDANGSCALRPQLVVPGGSQPDWGPANLPTTSAPITHGPQPPDPPPAPAPIPPGPPPGKDGSAPPAGRASLLSVRVHASAVQVTVYCPAATSGCSNVTASLTAVAHLAKGRVRKPTAASRVSKTRALKLGSTVSSLVAGQTSVLSVALNTQGRKLLRNRGRLKMTLDLSANGATLATRIVYVSSAKRKRHPSTAKAPPRRSLRGAG